MSLLDRFQSAAKSTLLTRDCLFGLHFIITNWMPVSICLVDFQAHPRTLYPVSRVFFDLPRLVGKRTNLGRSKKSRVRTLLLIIR